MKPKISEACEIDHTITINDDLEDKCMLLQSTEHQATQYYQHENYLK